MSTPPNDATPSLARRSRANGEGSAFKSATRGWCASLADLDGRRITRKAPFRRRRGRTSSWVGCSGSAKRAPSPGAR